MQTKFAPKDFFLQIAAFTALYVSVVSILTLLFQYINILFPDELYNGYDPFSSAIRFAMASLIIVFPLYIFFTRLVNKDMRMHQEKRDGAFRKWLIYITLFVAGATIAGDLIALVNTFLGGELTTRFMLKVLAILAIVGGGFWYYFLDLKGYWNREERKSVLIGSIVSLIVLGVLVGGFLIAGSPNEQRALRLDEERVQDLQVIQSQITFFWQQKERLPQTLSKLEDPLIGFELPLDPESEVFYVYEVTGTYTFTLCADFSRPTPAYLRGKTLLARDAYYLMGAASWEHEAGEVCFERTLDPDKFPPLKPSI